MPLTYDYSEVADYADLHEDTFQATITQVIVWTTVPLEVGVITEENYRLVHMGIQVLEMNGLLMHAPADESGKGRPYSITLRDVYRRIGLRTNSGSGSKAQIAKNIRRIISQRIKDNS